MNPRDAGLNSAAGLIVVGKDVPRTDAIAKVTGAAQYVADLHLPGMLHAAVLRCGPYLLAYGSSMRALSGAYRRRRIARRWLNYANSVFVLRRRPFRRVRPD